MNRILQVLEFAGADDRSAHTRLRQHPGESDLRIVHSALSCDLRDAIDNVVV